MESQEISYPTCRQSNGEPPRFGSKSTTAMVPLSASIDNIVPGGDVQQDPKDITQTVTATAIINDVEEILRFVKLTFDHMEDVIRILGIRYNVQPITAASPNREPVLKFQQDWDKIREDFNALVWRSKEVATTGAAHSRRYREYIHPLILDKRAPSEVKERTVTQFISAMDNVVKATEEMTDAFREFPKRVEDFRKQIPHVLEHFEAICRGTGQSEALKRGIEGLQKRLNGSQGQPEHPRAWTYGSIATSLSVGLGVHSYVTGSASAPVAALTIVGTAAVTMAGEKLFCSNPSRPAALEDRGRKISELIDLPQGNPLAMETLFREVLRITDAACGQLCAIGQSWASSMKGAIDFAKTPNALSNSHWDIQTTTPFQEYEDILLAYANHC